MKKILALLLALAIVLSFAACKKEATQESAADNAETTETTDPQEADTPAEPDYPPEGMTLYESKFFTVAADESTGWVIDPKKTEDNGKIDIGIPQDEVNWAEYVHVEAVEDTYESFCSSIESMGYDVAAYEAGEPETVEIGGQAMLVYNNSAGLRIFIAYDAEDGYICRVRTTSPDAPEAQAIMETIRFK